MKALLLCFMMFCSLQAEHSSTILKLSPYGKVFNGIVASGAENFHFRVFKSVVEENSTGQMHRVLIRYYTEEGKNDPEELRLQAEQALAFLLKAFQADMSEFVEKDFDLKRITLNLILPSLEKCTEGERFRGIFIDKGVVFDTYESNGKFYFTHAQDVR